ncbi:MAG TPA: ATP-binding protein [Solirubrobacteraceae bacterium]|nr:ATP-binding protein [Solirubrobacteraceae bacterium]
MSAALPETLDRRWQKVPFRARLTLGFAGAMVILFGGLALLLHVLVEHSLDQQIDRSLQTRAVDIGTLVDGRRVRDGLPSLPDSGGTFAQILEPHGGRVVAETSGHERPLVSVAQVRSALIQPRLINQRSARLRLSPVNTRPRTVLIVGSSLDQRAHTLTILSDLLFVGGPALLLLTCLAGYILAARALAPVEKMSAQAARISGAPGGKRLPIPQAHDEIRRLGDTLNDLLTRVEEALARERSFVADASHELRTPLAVLKLELEFALRAGANPAELQGRVRSAAEEVDRLTKIAEDLLFIARVDGGRLPLERHPASVEELLDAVVERFDTPARLLGRRLVREGAGTRAHVSVDVSWITQALGNLVSNALRYGDGAVNVAVLERGSEVELHVCDHGPGFDQAFLSCAFERFARADPARAGVGAGLGLSIVRAVAEAHGGSAGARNRAGGGADVWISLPRLREGTAAGAAGAAAPAQSPWTASPPGPRSPSPPSPSPPSPSPPSPSPPSPTTGRTVRQ